MLEDNASSFASKGPARVPRIRQELVDRGRSFGRCKYRSEVSEFGGIRVVHAIVEESLGAAGAGLDASNRMSDAVAAASKNLSPLPRQQTAIPKIRHSNHSMKTTKMKDLDTHLSTQDKAVQPSNPQSSSSALSPPSSPMWKAN